MATEVPLNIRIDDPDKLADDIQEQVMKGMGKWAVKIDAPYALYLEFGTAGATSKGPRPVKTFLLPNGTAKAMFVSEAYFSLYLWATRHVRPGEDPRSFAYLVYDKLCKEGLVPHPFIRPALHELEDNIEAYAQQAAEYDDPMEGFANILADLIRNNIGGPGAEGFPAPQDDRGLLKRLISVVRADQDEGSDIDWDRDISDSRRGPV